MSQDKIDKLRELAERGVDGERENARAMLTKAGIDWKKPKESLVDRVKKTVGMDIERKYKFPMQFTTDLLFLSVLVNDLTASKHKVAVGHADMTVTCTPAEIVDINALYKKHREDFGVRLYAAAGQLYKTLV